MKNLNTNKEAMAQIFALEDAKGVCEAFGGNMPLNDNSFDDDAEYDVNSIMDVTPSFAPTDGEVFPQGENDMDNPETQRFVVDAFAREAAKLPGNSIDIGDVPALATIIQAQNGLKGDVTGFIEKMMMDANKRLSAQNVSQALPSGATPSMDDGSVPEVDGAADIMPEAPMGDEGFAGDEGLVELPGAPEPTLDANADETADAGLGDFDLGLDDDTLGDLSTDDTLGEDTVGDLDLGETEDEDLGDIDLDGIGEEDAAESEGSAEDSAEDEDLDLGDLDFGDLDETEGSGDEDEDAPADTESVADMSAVGVFESAVADKLSGIRDQFVEQHNSDKVKSVIESYQRTKRMARVSSQLEAIANEFNADDLETTDESPDNEIGDDMSAGNIEECNQAQQDSEAKLEGIVNEFKKTTEASSTKVESLVGAVSKAIDASRRNDAARNIVAAKLESISANYHNAIAMAEAKKQQAAHTAAQLESIVTSFKAETNKKAQLESIVNNYKATVSADKKPQMESVEPSLQDKLNAIVRNARNAMK